MSGGLSGWVRQILGLVPGQPAERLRWTVVDCESSGLDPQRDRLLAIGAVAVEGNRISLEQGFSVVVRQELASERANILVHGISGSAQRTGVEPADALNGFASFAGDSPLVAFHASFDRALLRKAFRQEGSTLPNPWLDLAALAPALCPRLAHKCRALDDWLGAFGIDNPARYDALSDAFATALLFQVLLDLARRQGASTGSELFAVAGRRHWLGGAH